MPETPESAMRPQDVPPEWVALAKEADLAHMPTSDQQTARLIAAVLPAHEAMVRAKVAEEARGYAEGHLPVVRAVLHAFASRITTHREQT